MMLDKVVSVQFLKRTPFANIPKRLGGSEYARIWELVAHRRTQVNEKKYGYIEYGTGIAVNIPPDFIGIIYPANDINRTGLLSSSSSWIIPPGYKDEITLSFKWVPDTNMWEVGDIVGYLTIQWGMDVEWEEVEKFTNDRKRRNKLQ